MKNNPYKAFIAYTHAPFFASILRAGNLITDPDDATDVSDLANNAHSDPSGGEWRRAGLATVQGNQYVVPLGGSAWLMHVQFNERILPAKVRDEKVKKRVKEFVEREGRACTKKQYAEIRDEVEHELLPQAFIRRTVVPVVFIEPNYMLVFTSSPTRADSVTAIISGTMSEVTGDFACQWVLPKQNIVTSLTDMLNDDTAVECNFEIGDYAVLKSSDPEDKKTVRIKDLSLGSSDVSTLMKRDYRVHDIGLRFYDGRGYADSNVLLDFKLNDKFVFRACVIPDMQMESVSREDADAERVSFAWLTAKTCKTVLEELVEYMGGSASAVQNSGSTESEEEEL